MDDIPGGHPSAVDRELERLSDAEVVERWCADVERVPQGPPEGLLEHLARVPDAELVDARRGDVHGVVEVTLFERGDLRVRRHAERPLDPIRVSIGFGRTGPFMESRVAFEPDRTVLARLV